MTPSQRTTAIAATVLLLHGGGLWALQSGLMRRAIEIIVPAELLSQLIEPPQPKVEPPPPQPMVPVKPTVHTPTPPSAPQPVAVNDPTPAPNAPIGITTPQPPLPPIATPVAVATIASAAPTPPAPPKVELPSSDADYLNNPKPAYPPVSKKLGEQGRVIVRVLIGVDGSPQKAELRSSSGFDRLDLAAVNTVLKWRYVPGKRNGVVEAMWFNVPINFVLE